MAVISRILLKNGLKIKTIKQNPIFGPSVALAISNLTISLKDFNKIISYYKVKDIAFALSGEKNKKYILYENGINLMIRRLRILFKIAKKDVSLINADMSLIDFIRSIQSLKQELLIDDNIFKFKKSNEQEGDITLPVSIIQFADDIEYLFAHGAKVSDVIDYLKEIRGIPYNGHVVLKKFKDKYYDSVPGYKIPATDDFVKFVDKELGWQKKDKVEKK